MSAVDTAWFYRLKKGKYRRCSPVPATKPVKAKFGSKDNEVRHHTALRPGGSMGADRNWFNE
jgi:hypothetical protein